MLLKILLLSVGVGCVLVAVVCLLFALPLIFSAQEDESTETWRKGQRTATAVTAAIFLFTTTFAFVDFKYLAFNAPHYLTGFAAWYAIGLLARIAYLIWSRQLFSPILANEETEIFYMFFYAVGGPLVIYFAAKEVIRQKGDPFHDIKRML